MGPRPRVPSGEALASAAAPASGGGPGHGHRRAWPPVRPAGIVLVVAAALVVVVVAGRARGPRTTSGRAIPGGPTTRTETIARTFDVGGGRSMYLECAGRGSPTVVLVSGLRSSAFEWHTTDPESTSPAAPVFEQIARTNRVCAYDRPGTVVGDQISRSDPVPQPTDAAKATADLHALLAAAGEQGPFVPVGHSIGGTIVRLYAMTHPDQVVGMVLVDATSEFLQDAETPDQWRIQRVLMRVDAADIPESVAEYPDIERFDIDATFAELRAAPRLRPMPLVVLSADELLAPGFPALIASGAFPASVPPDFGAVFDAAQAEAQARLAELVPGAVHVTDTNSGHNIHLARPRLVVDAVRDVVARVRAGALELPATDRTGGVRFHRGVVSSPRAPTAVISTSP